MTNVSRVDDSSQLAVWRLPHILISCLHVDEIAAVSPPPPPLLLHKGQTQCLPVPCRQVGRNCSMVIFMFYYHELACLLVLWRVWAHKSQALASCSVQFYKYSLIKQLQFYNHTASSQLASSLGFVSKMLTSWQWIQSKFHQTLQARGASWDSVNHRLAQIARLCTSHVCFSPVGCWPSPAHTVRRCSLQRRRVGFCTQHRQEYTGSFGTWWLEMTLQFWEYNIDNNMVWTIVGFKDRL